MAEQNLAERVRIAAATTTQFGRAALHSITRTAPARWIAAPPSAHELRLIPQNLRTADPSLLAELYDGYFGLAGTVAAIGSLSPFAILPPSRAWQKELHAFGWLRHLAAAQDDIARERARGLIRDWTALGQNLPEIASETDISARRIIAWLCNSGFVLDHSDAGFYKTFMGALSRQIQTLALGYHEEAANIARLRALIALTLASLSVSEYEPYQDSFVPALCYELERQIFPDGGHVSRDPGILCDLLLDLLPLKQCFFTADKQPPEALYDVIERMMRMIRFMRLGSGSFARFNGMSATLIDHVSTVLAYDDHGYERPGSSTASDSGYGRLQQKDVVVIADTGTPPPLLSSERAHAGCLAFEMSSGNQEIIVNCGAPRDEDSEWRMVSRATAAHSTLSIDDISSSRLIKRQLLHPMREVHCLSGPKMVLSELATEGDDTVLRSLHDGYVGRFGLRHQRMLRLSQNGDALEGFDQLASPSNAAKAAQQDASFAVRFHLHPRITLRMLPEGRGVVLSLPDGERWLFRAQGARLDIEESIFLADPIFRRRCLQIVLSGTCASGHVIAWSLTRQRG